MNIFHPNQIIKLICDNINMINLNIAVRFIEIIYGQKEKTFSQIFVLNLPTVHLLNMIESIFF